MDHSYLYTKRFIDAQAKTLNQPLTIDSSVRNILTKDYDDGSTITDKQLARALAKINIKIKRHHNNTFSGQITNQVVQQVLKLEQSKLQEVNKQLARVRSVLKPLMLPDYDELTSLEPGDKLTEFAELIRDLPQAKYLIVDDTAEENEQESDSNQSSEEEDQILVQDEEDRIEHQVSKSRLKSHQKRKVANQVKQMVEGDGTKELLGEYERLRIKLQELNTQLHYKHEKKIYLTNLRQELINITDITAPGNVDSDEEDTSENGIEGIQSNFLTSVGAQDVLTTELNRFRILVEKVGYKLNSSTDKREIRSIIHDLNQ